MEAAVQTETKLPELDMDAFWSAFESVLDANLGKRLFVFILRKVGHPDVVTIELI